MLNLSEKKTQERVAVGFGFLANFISFYELWRHLCRDRNFSAGMGWKVDSKNHHLLWGHAFKNGFKHAFKVQTVVVNASSVEILKMRLGARWQSRLSEVSPWYITRYCLQYLFSPTVSQLYAIFVITLVVYSSSCCALDQQTWFDLICMDERCHVGT